MRPQPQHQHTQIYSLHMNVLGVRNIVPEIKRVIADYCQILVNSKSKKRQCHFQSCFQTHTNFVTVTKHSCASKNSFLPFSILSNSFLFFPRAVFAHLLHQPLAVAVALSFQKVSSGDRAVRF